MLTTRFLLVLAFSWLCAAPFLHGAEKGEGELGFDKVFPASAVPVYHLHISRARWDRIDSAPHRKEYVRAALVYTLGKVEERYEDVAVRFKGNFSLRFAFRKRSFKIDFNRFEKKQTFHGFKKINLHNNLMNPTHIRERLAYGLFRKAGVPAPRAAHARVFLTVPGVSERKYLGVYSVVEQIDKTFLEERFRDSTGTLIKVRDRADLTWKGWDPEAYRRDFIIRTNEKDEDPDPFIRFLHVLNEAPRGHFAETIEKVFNVDSFLSFLAVNTVISNFDAYPAMARNYYLYENRVTGRIEFIPWDMNAVFGIAAQFFGMDPEAPYRYGILDPHRSSKKRPLVSRLLGVPAFRRRYIEKVESFLEEHFTEEKMNAEIDALAALILPAVVEDKRKYFSDEVFERAIERDVTLEVEHIPGVGEYTAPGLKSFVRRRVRELRKQLDSFPVEKGD